MRKSVDLLGCFILIFSFVSNSYLKTQMPGADDASGMQDMDMGAMPGMTSDTPVVASVPAMPGAPGVVDQLPVQPDAMAMQPALPVEQSAPAADMPAFQVTGTQFPAMVQEEQPAQAVAQPAGPETVAFADDKIGVQGNWVKKREWVKEAQKVNVQVQDLVFEIQKARKGFTDKFVGIDNDLDTFYKQDGFLRGKVEDVFESIEKYLDKKQKKVEAELKAKKEDGVTTEYQIKLDMLEDQLASDKKDLEQLKFDMKSIEDLDKSVVLRLKTLDEQIKVASDQSTKSKELFEQIWYMIDDKKARASYYELNGNIFEHVKSIKNYIENDLTRDFDNVLSVIRTQISKVQQKVKELESKGLIVRNRSERLKELKLKKLETEAGIAQPDMPVQLAKKQEPKSWYTNLYDSVVDSVARSYVKIKKLFGIKTAVAKPAAVAVATMPVDNTATAMQMDNAMPVLPSAPAMTPTSQMMPVPMGASSMPGMPDDQMSMAMPPVGM